MLESSEPTQAAVKASLELLFAEYGRELHSWPYMLTTQIDACVKRLRKVKKK